MTADERTQRNWLISGLGHVRKGKQGRIKEGEKKKKRVSGPKWEWKHREDMLKQIKMNRTCILQQKEAVIPACLGFSDHHPLYLGVSHIRLTLCKVLNPKNELKSIYCVLTYTRNIKNPGNAPVIFFHPFCNHYIGYV